MCFSTLLLFLMSTQEFIPDLPPLNVANRKNVQPLNRLQPAQSQCRRCLCDSVMRSLLGSPAADWLLLHRVLIKLLNWFIMLLPLSRRRTIGVSSSRKNLMEAV